MKDQFLFNVRNPLLHNHKVHGKYVLPGLAYIDLLYQIFRGYGYDYRGIELRDVTMYVPLIVGKADNVLVTIDSTKTVNDGWRITIEGESPDAGSLTGERTRYVTAQIRTRALVEFAESIQEHRIRDLATSTCDLQEFYDICRERGVEHSGIMKAQGTQYVFDGETYLCCSVNECSSEIADAIMFHPASHIFRVVLCVKITATKVLDENSIVFHAS
jgi:hypothetical protein